MINRSQSPTIHSIDNPRLPQSKQHLLDNGIPLYEINMGTQDVIRVELSFKAGRWYEQHPLVAKTTSRLLKMGTEERSAKEFVEHFDFLGAKLKVFDGFHTVSVQLSCLTKHLAKLLPVVYEMLTQPTLSASELTKFIKRNAQNLKVQLKKNDIVAYRLFTEKLFGQDHPYGYNSTADLYQQLSIDKVKKHFGQCYNANGCMIFVAGKVAPFVIPLINQYFGQLKRIQPQALPHFEVSPKPPFSPLFVHSNGQGQQTSIRVGLRTFDRKHEDWNAFFMMNMILGGYFGARLMQNLRNKHGFTYGVYASMETLLTDGYWYIHTDVGKDVKGAALTEIYNEMERLKKEPVPKEELEMVRNYAMGQLLSSLDGVMNAAMVIKSFIMHDVGQAQFDSFTDTIRHITPKEIQTIAQKYLLKEHLMEVVVE